MELKYNSKAKTWKQVKKPQTAKEKKATQQRVKELKKLYKDYFTFIRIINSNKDSSIIDLAFAFEAAGLWPNAIDTYLSFWLWIEKLPRKTKLIFVNIGFYDV